MTSQLVPFQCRRTSLLLAESVMPASASSPVAVIAPAPAQALLVMSTELTATPTPMPTLALAVVSPLPCADESVLAKDLRVSAPLSTTMVTPSATYAVLTVVTMFTAKAAASDNEASPEDSFSLAVPFFGVSGLSVVFPSLLFAACVSLPFLRLLSAFLFESSPLLSSLAPSAAASASDVVLDAPEASKMMPSSACRSRDVCASTVWLTTARARVRPIPAVPPTVVSPLAVVSTSPSKSALTSMPCVTSISAPAPMAATDDSFAIDTAMDEKMATSPAPPPSVSVVSESELVDVSFRSRAPDAGGPFEGDDTGSKPVKTSLLTRLSASETPMPTVTSPSCLALALVVLLLLEVAAMTMSP